MRALPTLVLLLIACTSLPTLSSSASALGLTCGQTIKSSTLLTADVTGCAGDGIVIGSDGLTLDCQGHTIRGMNLTNTNGILVAGRRNVKITNCTSKNFYNGFYIDNSLIANLTSNNANYNTNGFYLDSSNNSLLVSNTAFGTGYATGGWGFKLGLSFNNTVVSNTESNYAYGFIVDSQTFSSNGTISLSTFNVLRSNTVARNSNTLGFEVKTSSSVFANNSACGQYTGFAVSYANNNSFLGNVVCDNLSSGLDLDNSYDNVLKSNIFTGNLDALFISSSARNLIYNNIFNNPVDISQVAADTSQNFWNITKTPGTSIGGGPFLGGNYWQLYSGKDLNGDGFGDATPYIPGASSVIRDYLPLCTTLGCPSDVKRAFELDWSDYDNDGVVTIADIAQIAFVYGRASTYWDLYLVNRVGINNVAIVAYYYGQSSIFGQGQPTGHMDPVWKQFCNFLPSADRMYCQSLV